MNNKDNKYNQYRKKRVSAYFLACNAPEKMITKKVRKATEHQLDEYNNFFQFFNTVRVIKDGIRFNNHKHE